MYQERDFSTLWHFVDHIEMGFWAATKSAFKKGKGNENTLTVLLKGFLLKDYTPCTLNKKLVEFDQMGLTDK